MALDAFFPRCADSWACICTKTKTTSCKNYRQFWVFFTSRVILSSFRQTSLHGWTIHFLGACRASIAPGMVVIKAQFPVGSEVGAVPRAIYASDVKTALLAQLAHWSGASTFARLPLLLNVYTRIGKHEFPVPIVKSLCVQTAYLTFSWSDKDIPSAVTISCRNYTIL